MKQLLHVFIFLCCSIGAQSQVLQDWVLEAPSMHADLDSLDVLIRATHQDMYYFASPASWENTLNWAYQECEKPLPYPEFAAIVATLLRTLQDSHTYLDFGHLGRQIRAATLHKPGIVWEKDQGGIYIKHALSDSVPAGSYIETWNGQAVDQIYDRVARYGIREGASLKASAEVNMVLFGSLLPLVTDVQANNTFTYRVNGDTLQDTFTCPKTSKKRLSWLKRDTDHLVFEVLPNQNLAILKVGSFSDGSRRYYYRFLRQSFKTIEKEGIVNLAIDIRHNTGGSSGRMTDLMRYIAHDSLAVPKQIAYLQSPQSLALLQSKYGWFTRMMYRFYESKNDHIRNFTHMVNTPIGQADTLAYAADSPFSKFHFSGPCYLMMDGLSGSASVSMASIFAQEERGEIVGQPCLGPISGTWGNPLSIALPETGLRIIISTLRFDASGDFDKNPTSVQPTVPVKVSAHDRALGNDPVRVKVVNLVGDQASSPN